MQVLVWWAGISMGLAGALPIVLHFVARLHATHVGAGRMFISMCVFVTGVLGAAVLTSKGVIAVGRVLLSLIRLIHRA